MVILLTVVQQQMGQVREASMETRSTRGLWPRYRHLGGRWVR